MKKIIVAAFAALAIVVVGGSAAAATDNQQSEVCYEHRDITEAQAKYRKFTSPDKEGPFTKEYPGTNWKKGSWVKDVGEIVDGPKRHRDGWYVYKRIDQQTVVVGTEQVEVPCPTVPPVTEPPVTEPPVTTVPPVEPPETPEPTVPAPEATPPVNEPPAAPQGPIEGPPMLPETGAAEVVGWIAIVAFGTLLFGLGLYYLSGRNKSNLLHRLEDGGTKYNR